MPCDAGLVSPACADRASRCMVEARAGDLVRSAPGQTAGAIHVRILIVEDDKDLNRQLAEALLEQGYVVDRAHDANKIIY